MKMKKLRLDIEIEPELMDIEYVSDKERLSQVIVNLLSNSLKFTYKGFIRIKIQKCTDNIH
jgi:signal transduction histidine kinase